MHITLSTLYPGERGCRQKTEVKFCGVLFALHMAWALMSNFLSRPATRSEQPTIDKKTLQPLSAQYGVEPSEESRPLRARARQETRLHSVKLGICECAALMQSARQTVWNQPLTRKPYNPSAHNMAQNHLKSLRLCKHARAKKRALRPSDSASVSAPSCRKATTKRCGQTSRRKIENCLETVRNV